MTAERLRADRMLVESGLFESRARAQAAIRAGLVSADGQTIARPSDAIFRDARIEARPAHPYVSRGGLKLEAALDAFGLDSAGRFCLDVGASTGGFTDLLLRRGARHVVAVDVGRGQLHASLCDDPRVTSLEGTDIRALPPRSDGLHQSRSSSHPPPHREVPKRSGGLEGALQGSQRHLEVSFEAADAAPRIKSGAGSQDEGECGRIKPSLEAPGLVTIDVSFISLRLVLPAIVPLMAADAALVALVKPQFEAGRARVGRGGIVRAPEVHEAVCAEVRACVEGLGLSVLGLIPSPVEGGDGNREFLIGARRVR